MCGIAGILRVHPPGQPPPPPELAIPESWLDILDESIKHRGPDGHGRFRDRATRPDGSVVDVALVHRRLSIIDHAGGHQPMVSQGAPTVRSETRRGGEGSAFQRTPTVREGPETRSPPGPASQATNLVAVVFNGCIYNHRDLRKELTAAGHHFVTDHSDTETIIHGWRQWGSDFFRDHARGMFAVGLWDAASGRLIVARDRFGEKPLYLAAWGDGQWWAFAGTAGALSSLLQEIDTPAASSPLAMAEWTSFGYHPFRTPSDAVFQLPQHTVVTAPAARPSHFTRAMQDGPAGLAKRPFRRSFPTRESARQTLVRIESLLEQAVQRQLEADVWLGCFLSGGIDSSLVALYAHRNAGGLRTICVRMPEQAYDESQHAAAAAAIIGSDHLTVDAVANPAEDLIFLIHTLGLPFGDSSLLPTYWASRAAAEEVGVALSGDGGDELFLGYDRYAAAPWLSLAGMDMGLLKVLPLERLLDRSDPRSRSEKAARFLTAARHNGYLDLLAIFPTPDRRRLLSAPMADVPRESPPAHIATAQAYDLLNHLPGDMLRKVDTASMAAGLEVRCPFLDADLAEAALRLPVARVRLGRQRKGLLRAIARRHFPSDFVNRPKQGFAIPIGDWFRTDYGSMKTLLMDHLNSTEPWGSPSLGIDLNMKFVRQMLNEHMNKKRDHSQRLYMLLALSIWAKGLSP